MWLRAAALALAALATISAAPAPDPMQAFTCLNALLNRGEYLKAAELLPAVSSAFPDLPDQVMPFVTGTAPRLSKPGDRADRDDLRRFSRAQLSDAIAEIVRRARRTSIVILNEEHDSPRDRAFALEVARALRPFGYSLLAAEAFSSSPDARQRMAKANAMLDAGYPRLSAGFYTKDPVFGDFVRQSLALGYRPIVYEYAPPKGSPPPADNVAAREQGEADNLVAAIFNQKPAAKVLIYVGYSHAAEVPVSGSEWMASRLKRMTVVDPLTIYKTTLSPSAFDSKGRALYTALRPRFDRRSVVPKLNGKPLRFGDLGAAVDLQVVHPPERSVRGRPDWLLAMGRKVVPVPADLMPRSGRVLVQAFLDNEADDAVPVDQIVVIAGHKPPPLLVPAGALRFRVRSGYRPGDCDAPQKASVQPLPPAAD
jgi:hypothetical protein